MGILEFKYGSRVGPGIAACRLECVDPGTTEYFLELQCKSWYSSVYVRIPVLFLVFHSEFVYFSMYPGILLWIIGLQCSSAIPVGMLGIQCNSLD